MFRLSQEVENNAQTYRESVMYSRTVFAKEHNEDTSVRYPAKTGADTNLCLSELSKTDNPSPRSQYYFP